MIMLYISATSVQMRPPPIVVTASKLPGQAVYIKASMSKTNKPVFDRFCERCFKIVIVTTHVILFSMLSFQMLKCICILMKFHTSVFHFDAAISEDAQVF